MTNEVLGLMEERRQYKSDIAKYKTLTKNIKKKCNEAKEKWINDQCLEIEIKQNSDSKYIHDKLKDVSGKRTCSSSGCIKSKDGSILIDKADVLNRWSEYIEELFDDEREKITNNKQIDRWANNFKR